MPFPNLIEPLRAIESILAHHDRITQTQIAAPDSSPKVLADTFYQLETKEPSKSLK